MLFINSILKKILFGKEQNAFKEFCTHLGSFFDEVNNDLQYDEIDISKEIFNDIKTLRVSFFNIYYTYKSILYISNTSSFSPTIMFLYLKNKNILFQYIQRIVPIEKFFQFNEKNILNELTSLNEFTNYKILYEERFAPNEIKNKIFELIISNINLKVDLKTPEIEIIVQVLKTHIGMTILKNFNGSFNFSKNLM